jgi:TonB family protein
MLTEGDTRSWTVLFSEPLDLRQGRPALAAGVDSTAIGMVLPHDQIKSAFSELSRLGARPAPLLMVGIAGDVASMDLFDTSSGEVVSLGTFPAGLDLLRRDEYRPFDCVYKQAIEPIRPRAEQAVRPAAAVAPAAPRVAFPTLRIPPVGRVAQAALLVLVTGFGVWYFTRTTIAPANTRPVPVTRTEPRPFGIEVGRREGDLEIRWNRNVSSLQTAVSGVLKIADGEQRVAIPLSKSDLLAGQLLYKSRSTDLGLEMTVETPSGAVTETVRVLFAPNDPLQARTRVVAPSQPAQLPQPAQVRSQETAPQDAAEQPTRSTSPGGSFAAPANSSPAPPAPTPVLESSLPDIGAVAANRPVPLPGGLAVQPPPTVAPPSSAVSPQPSNPAGTPPVRRLVQFQPPVPVKQVQPSVPEMLRRGLFRSVVVEVNVTVDSAGRVVSATTPAYSGAAAHLAAIAKDAAHAWRFEPARRDGQPVRSEFVIRFSFDRSR